MSREDLVDLKPDYILSPLYELKRDTSYHLFVEKLVEAINRAYDENSLLVVSVFGRQGSGKTTFMLYVMYKVYGNWYDVFKRLFYDDVQLQLFTIEKLMTHDRQRVILADDVGRWFSKWTHMTRENISTKRGWQTLRDVTNTLLLTYAEESADKFITDISNVKIHAYKISSNVPGGTALFEVALPYWYDFNRRRTWWRRSKIFMWSPGFLFSDGMFMDYYNEYKKIRELINAVVNLSALIQKVKGDPSAAIRVLEQLGTIETWVKRLIASNKDIEHNETAKRYMNKLKILVRVLRKTAQEVYEEFTGGRSDKQSDRSNN